MERSIFGDLISKYIKAVAAKITEKINGKKEEKQYLHKLYLKKDMSPDMKWHALSTNTSVVAADIVALDSKLPLKKRGSTESAEGEVPKIGMEKYLSESNLQAIKNLQARNKNIQQIVSKLFNDTGDGVKGVYQRLEIMFLQALSTGVTLIDSENNTGVGVRIDFGVPQKNLFGVTKPWSDPDATPIDDIENITSNAMNNGTSLKYMWIDKATFTALKKNKQVIEAYAGYNKLNPAHVFRMSNDDLIETMSEEFSLSVIVVDPTGLQIEKGGKTSAYNPWESGNVSFTTSTDLGTLTWSELAEVEHPVKDVEYGIVDEFILVSMYRTNNPLKENTNVQALALPVLENTSSIYIMDTKEATASEDTQTEGDSTYTYNGTDYTKQSVVDGINAAREVDSQVAKATIAQQDTTLAKKIDSLSEEGIALFEAELINV